LLSFSGDGWIAAACRLDCHSRDVLRVAFASPFGVNLSDSPSNFASCCSLSIFSLQMPAEIAANILVARHASFDTFVTTQLRRFMKNFSFLLLSYFSALSLAEIYGISLFSSSKGNKNI
jgi:hypothetical protein